MIEILPALVSKEYKLIEQLADTIWREHYPSIISMAQIDYMLSKFNSTEAIKDQINQGALFYYMTYNNIHAGYMSIKPEKDFLFLSKLYVLQSHRGKKIGKSALGFIISEANRLQLKSIQLKVNKFNTASISAYEKLGFKKLKAIVTEIGEGFIMDDYLMEKVLI